MAEKKNDGVKSRKSTTKQKQSIQKAKSAAVEKEDKKHESGESWPEEIRARAIAMYIANGNAYRCAKKLGVPESTLRSWIKAEAQENGEIAELLIRRREHLLNRAFDALDMSIDALRDRLYLTVECGEEMLALVTELCKGEYNLDTAQRKAILDKISRIAIPDTRELSSAFASIYDKVEHMRTGEDPSANKFEVTVKIDD